MQAEHPLLNARDEHELFLKQADTRDFKPTAKGFEKYMKLARPKLGRLKKKTVLATSVPGPEPCDESARAEKVEKFRMANRKILPAMPA